MSLSFNTSPKLLFSSESVTEGHPDKMCDQISDAVVDAIMADDPNARIACETSVKTGFVMLLGEITTTTFVDFDKLVREVVNDIGFDSSEKGFDANTCAVQVAVAAQSPDIAQGVDSALEERQGEMSDADIDAVGAGDQGMMFGYACNETPTLMPLPIDLSHRLARRLSEVRKDGTLPWLRPDGKAQVTVEYAFGKPKRIHEYAFGKPKRIHTVLISTQHAPEISEEEIRASIIEHVFNPVLPKELVDDDLLIYVNPTMGRHGGGAFSGKDCTKVDRSAAYATRWVAKNIVAAGLADRCEVQVAYAIGVASPLSVSVETFDTGKLSNDQLTEVITEVSIVKLLLMVTLVVTTSAFLGKKRTV